MNSKNIAMWETQHNNADKDCFKTLILRETLKTQNQHLLDSYTFSEVARDLEDSKSTSGRILCIFGSHTFVPTSWMGEKQISVSHSSTEVELLSLDAGLRMDGIPALDLWDLVIEVFHSPANQINKANDVRGQRGELVAKHHIPHEKPKSN